MMMLNEGSRREELSKAGKMRMSCASCERNFRCTVEVCRGAGIDCFNWQVVVMRAKINGEYRTSRLLCASLALPRFRW